MKNLCQDNGYSLEEHCVKTSLFLVKMEDFAKVNEIYSKYFTKEFPARTTVAVKELPKGALFEIEAVLFK